MNKPTLIAVSGVVGAAVGAVLATVIGLAIYFVVRDSTSTLPTRTVTIEGTVVEAAPPSTSVTCVRAAHVPAVSHLSLVSPVCAGGATARIGAAVSGQLLLVETDPGSGYQLVWMSLHGHTTTP